MTGEETHMGQSFFIWNGIDCRSMGIYLTGPAPIVRPEERVQHVQIPGVSGDLTQIEGENIFNSYIQTVTLHVKNSYRVREVFDWLRGAGYVTFSGEPDRKQRARIIGAVTLNKFSRNIDTWIGECQFYCQPLKERLTEETERVSQSGTEVLNLGDVAAHPLISCHATDAWQEHLDICIRFLFLSIQTSREHLCVIRYNYIALIKTRRKVTHTFMLYLSRLSVQHQQTCIITKTTGELRNQFLWKLEFEIT